MSVDAVAWAYKQKIKSSVKFVLVTLCDFANERGRLWPSIATICERTCQDRKTVMSAIDELVRQGCLIDTGERKGDTKQVKVYEICKKDLSINSTKNGIVKEYQKRNSTKNGTVPNFPVKSTVFPMKEYQISHERVPNLVHGTYIEPLDEPLDEPSDIRQVSENLPVIASPQPVENRKNEVDVVFNHWKEVMHSPRSVLDNNRKKKIQAALKHYSVADLLKAINGCSLSAFHMGANENGMKYNSIDLIFRNSEKIEQFMSFVDKPPNAKNESIEEQNARNKESIFGPIDEPYIIIQ